MENIFIVNAGWYGMNESDSGRVQIAFQGEPSVKEIGKYIRLPKLLAQKSDDKVSSVFEDERHPTSFSLSENDLGFTLSMETIELIKNTSREEEIHDENKNNEEI